MCDKDLAPNRSCKSGCVGCGSTVASAVPRTLGQSLLVEESENTPRAFQDHSGKALHDCTKSTRALQAMTAKSLQCKKDTFERVKRLKNTLLDVS